MPTADVIKRLLTCFPDDTAKTNVEEIKSLLSDYFVKKTEVIHEAIQTQIITKLRNHIFKLIAKDNNNPIAETILIELQKTFHVDPSVSTIIKKVMSEKAPAKLSYTSYLVQIGISENCFKIFLEIGLDPNALDKEEKVQVHDVTKVMRRAPVHYALEEKRLDLLQLLFANGANFRAADKTLRLCHMAVHLAYLDISACKKAFAKATPAEQEVVAEGVRKKHFDILKFLVETIKLDINSLIEDDNSTPLSIACAYGETKLVAFLIFSCGATLAHKEDNEMLNKKLAYFSPFVAALLNNHFSILNFLLNYFVGTEKNDIRLIASSLMQALFSTTKLDPKITLEVFQLLARFGFDFNSELLLYQKRSTQKRAAKILKSHTAIKDPNEPILSFDKHKITNASIFVTPLYACMNMVENAELVSLVQFLLAHGANITKVPHFTDAYSSQRRLQQSPLIITVLRNQAEIAKMLCDKLKTLSSGDKKTLAITQLWVALDVCIFIRNSAMEAVFKTTLEDLDENYSAHLEFVEKHLKERQTPSGQPSSFWQQDGGHLPPVSGRSYIIKTKKLTRDEYELLKKDDEVLEDFLVSRSITEVCLSWSDGSININDVRSIRSRNTNNNNEEHFFAAIAESAFSEKCSTDIVEEFTKDSKKVKFAAPEGENGIKPIKSNTVVTVILNGKQYPNCNVQWEYKLVGKTDRLFGVNIPADDKSANLILFIHYDAIGYHQGRDPLVTLKSSCVVNYANKKPSKNEEDPNKKSEDKYQEYIGITRLFS